MSKRLLFTLPLLFSWAAAPTPAQTAVYKLLWSPGSLDTPGGQPATIFEVSPGLFYVLGSSVQSTYGASAFSITSTGTYKLLYSLPPYFNASALVQATDGHLYGPAFKGETQQNLYFSTTAAGNDMVQYPFPGQWGSANQTIAAPGELFDIVGLTTTGASIFGFGKIWETGQITILHQFSGSDGTPTGHNIVLGTPISMVSATSSPAE